MTTFKTISYLNQEGYLSDECQIKPDDKTLLKIYKTMVLTRLVDEKMITLQRQGVISFAMSSFGEEACSVGSAAALKLEDWLYPQYRENGIMFWRGFSVEEYIHQMFGDCKDLSFGRQMPNHFGKRELNVVTVSSPIGTKIPHAAGCAYAMKLQKEESIAVAYFGEGATSEGDFHCGLNFAAVRKAPVIFFCRNNGYAISTPASKQFRSDGIAPKGLGYGIKTFRIDGNDIFAIFETTYLSRKYCLEEKAPVLIEAMTYRMGAHSTSDDPTLYRTLEEENKWISYCPILRLKKYLENQNLWNEKEDKELHLELTKSIQEAIQIAKNTNKPPLTSLIEHVYFEVPKKLKDELSTLKKLLNEDL